MMFDAFQRAVASAADFEEAVNAANARGRRTGAMPEPKLTKRERDNQRRWLCLACDHVWYRIQEPVACPVCLSTDIARVPEPETDSK